MELLSSQQDSSMIGPKLLPDMNVCSETVYLHELEGGFKVFHRVHFDSEELEAHDEADGGLDDVGALLLLPQLL